MLTDSELLFEDLSVCTTDFIFLRTSSLCFAPAWPEAINLVNRGRKPVEERNFPATVPEVLHCYRTMCSPAGAVVTFVPLSTGPRAAAWG